MVPLSPHIAEDVPPYGSRLFHGQENLWKQPDDPMEDSNVNLATWAMFVNTTLRKVHLGKDCDMNLRSVKNYLWETTGQLFKETKKLISRQTETTGISLINFQDLRWVSTSLLHSRAYQYSTAKVYVFSDSVLCLGKLGDNPVGSWKKPIQWYSDNNYFSELKRIAGQLLDVEWKISKHSLQWQSSIRFCRWMGAIQCEAKNFTGSFIFMSLFNDIVWVC